MVEFLINLACVIIDTLAVVLIAIYVVLFGICCAGDALDKKHMNKYRDSATIQERFRNAIAQRDKPAARAFVNSFADGCEHKIKNECLFNKFCPECYWWKLDEAQNEGKEKPE